MIVGGGGYEYLYNHYYYMVPGHVASGAYSAILGGLQNTASGYASVVVGGGLSQYVSSGNVASGDYSAILGGTRNQSTGSVSAIGGGENNSAGDYSVVPGGYGNSAGRFCFSAGDSARANLDGSFVWADHFNRTINSSVPFYSTATNSFNVRARGGFYFVTGVGGNDQPNAGVTLASGSTAWATISDQNAKKNFTAVNGAEVLNKLAAVPVEKWNYKWEKDSDVPNIGPMAQAFKAAFYPGRDDKSITTLEFDGVELAAIQGLNEKLESRSEKLEAENAALKAQLNELKVLVQQLAAGKQK